MSSELGVERPTTLALPESQVERRVHFSDVASACVVSGTGPTSVPSTASGHKLCSDHDFRTKRKRSASFSGTTDFRFNNKRRKKSMVLPSKFLLGGSITDPLNLGSLDKDEAAHQPKLNGRLGKEGLWCWQSGKKTTGLYPPELLLDAAESAGGALVKRSSAVRVIIPPNINDPLNLDASSENEESLTDALQKQIRRRRRSRKRKRRLSEPGGEIGDLFSQDIDLDAEHSDGAEEPSTTVAAVLLSNTPSISTMTPLTVNTEITTQMLNEERRDSAGAVTPTGAKSVAGGPQRPVFKKQRSKSDNKIVSPVVPQPGVERKRHPSFSRHHADKPHLSQQNLLPPKMFNPKNELFQYGNYNKYYGYRNPDQTPDPRLRCFKRSWFEGKEVLDIGCNIGHIALTVARDFNPKRVVGIDIDKKLIKIADKNIKHYLRKGDAQESNFPKSMRLLYGSLKPPVHADGSRTFPHNIKFIHANYVLESDELLETVRPEFDLILCLSITKWVHLNWGDSGLKRFFRRIFQNLKAGGRLILEPQGWPSYNKRRKLTKRIFDNYKGIRLFPEKFNDFLLHEVGFSTSEKMATPHHISRGFQRPIIIYTKASSSTKSSPKDERIQKNFSRAGVASSSKSVEAGRQSSVDSEGIEENAVEDVGEKQDNSRVRRATEDDIVKEKMLDRVEQCDRQSEERTSQKVKDETSKSTRDLVPEQTGILRGVSQEESAVRNNTASICDNILDAESSLAVTGSDKLLRKVKNDDKCNDKFDASQKASDSKSLLEIQSNVSNLSSVKDSQVNFKHGSCDKIESELGEGSASVIKSLDDESIANMKSDATLSNKSNSDSLCKTVDHRCEGKNTLLDKVTKS